MAPAETDEFDAATRDHRLEGSLAAYLQARQNPSREELLIKHPDLATELNEFFRNQDQVEKLVAAPMCGPGSAASNSVSEQPLLGKARYVGDYELLQEIARGGMGIVYRARQVSLNRPVALKMILAGQLASPEEVQRFRMEAEAAANLDYPNIVTVYEVGEHEGQHFFSMRLIEGRSLAQQIANSQKPGSLDKPGLGAIHQHAAAQLLATVARAVDYAHQRGILHRDLKPGNILLDANGQPHVTDFGLAKRIQGDSSLTRTRAVLGTPSYMPPEQASGDKEKLGPASDVYALGAILYELLTGRPPFRAHTPLSTVLQVLHSDPVALRSLNAKIDRDLETVTLKCLEKEPQRRYASAQELAEDLERYLRDEPIQARPVSRTERVRRWCRRNPLWLATGALLVCMAAVTLSVAEHRRRTVGEAKARLADTEQQLEQTREVLEITEQTLESKLDAELQSIRQTPNSYFRRGYDYYQMGRYREAIYTFTKATELGELGINEAAIYFFRGKSHAVFDEDEQALADYTRSIEADPNYSHAYKERAFVYASSRICPNYKLAIEDAEQALERTTNEPPQFQLDIVRIYSLASRSAPARERPSLLERAKELLASALEDGLDPGAIAVPSAKDKYNSIGPLLELPEVQSLLKRGE